MWRETERTGIVHPGEEKAQGDIICVYKCLTEEYKEDEPGASQWCPVKEQEAMDTNWINETPLNMRKKPKHFFYCEDGQILYQVAQRFYGVSIL